MISKIVAYCVEFFKPKYHSYKDHRDTATYRKKKRIVKKVWIAAGLIMLMFIGCDYFVGIVMTISLLTTFISFFILDEMGTDND